MASVLLLLPRAGAAAPAVSGDQSGLGGTTHAMAFDGNLSTFFRSSYDNWQYLQIDFGASGLFSGLRRYITVDGSVATGNRGAQGEAVSYSVDGVTWHNLAGTNSSGWQNYVNYGAALDGWHSVTRGWSAWLTPHAPVWARYIRFRWDGAGDALNEVELRFDPRIVAGPERSFADPPNGLGTKKVAIIMYNFADTPDTPYTVAEVRQRLATAPTSVRAFFRENSFDAFSVGGHLHPDGDVFGWFILSPENKSIQLRASELRMRAAADGFNAANYDVILYLKPDNGGWYFGGDTGKEATVALGEDHFAHESLHVLGLDHANGMRCTNHLGAVDTIGDEFGDLPYGAAYGDPFDLMGIGGMRHLNAYFKMRLGWFLQSNVATVPMDRPQTFIYTLKPIEQFAPGQVMCVRVPVPAGRIPLSLSAVQPTDAPLFYYLEFRRPIGFDAPFGPNAEVTTGVSIHLGTDIDLNHTTYLMDSDPVTPGQAYGVGFHDAPFTQGQQLDDPVAGVRIRVLSVTPSEATIEVRVRANAELSQGSHLLWTEPSNGVAALWSTDGFGTNQSGHVSYGPYRGMRATHYQRIDGATARLLWTRDDGLNKIWYLDARDNVRGVKTIATNGYQARSYQKLPDGTARLLLGSNGLARLLRLDANDNPVSHVDHALAGWTARSYQKLPAGNGKLLWSHTDGRAGIWDLGVNDQFVSSRLYGPYFDWTATDYRKLPDNTGRLTWTRIDGVASVWRLSANDDFTAVVQHGPFPGWSLEDFDYGTGVTPPIRARLVGVPVGNFLIVLHGIPATRYAVERTENFGSWSPFAIVTTGVEGSVVVDSGLITGARFYRSWDLDR